MPDAIPAVGSEEADEHCVHVLQVQELHELGQHPAQEPVPHCLSLLLQDWDCARRAAPASAEE